MSAKTSSTTRVVPFMDVLVTECYNSILELSCGHVRWSLLMFISNIFCFSAPLRRHTLGCLLLLPRYTMRLATSGSYLLATLLRFTTTRRVVHCMMEGTMMEGIMETQYMEFRYVCTRIVYSIEMVCVCVCVCVCECIVYVCTCECMRVCVRMYPLPSCGPSQPLASSVGLPPQPHHLYTTHISRAVRCKQTPKTCHHVPTHVTMYPHMSGFMSVPLCHTCLVSRNLRPI